MPRAHKHERRAVSVRRNAIDGKCSLLGDVSRVVLRRLAIFASEFTLEAAGAIVARRDVQKPQVVASLTELETGSLLECKREAGSARYRLPEIVRAHALKRLADSGESEFVARQHAEYFQHLFEDAEVQLDRQVASQWIADYGCYIDEVRAALDWAFSSAGDGFVGVGLTVAAMPLWVLSSRPDELCYRIARALESKAAATHSAREMQLRAAARLAGMSSATLQRIP